MIATGEAIRMARDVGLDLVEVSPAANPPVCRILDYGKWKYEQAKKERDARKHQRGTMVHEVRMRPRTGQHDIDMKVRIAQRLLAEGDKVKVSIMFRGREMAHPEVGREVLEKALVQLRDIAGIEKPPGMEGRFLSVILTPNAEAEAAKAAPQENAAEASPSGKKPAARRARPAPIAKAPVAVPAAKAPAAPTAKAPVAAPAAKAPAAPTAKAPETAAPTKADPAAKAPEAAPAATKPAAAPTKAAPTAKKPEAAPAAKKPAAAPTKTAPTAKTAKAAPSAKTPKVAPAAKKPAAKTTKAASEAKTAEAAPTVSGSDGSAAKS